MLTTEILRALPADLEWDGSVQVIRYPPVGYRRTVEGNVFSTGSCGVAFLQPCRAQLKRPLSGAEQQWRSSPFGSRRIPRMFPGRSLAA